MSKEVVLIALKHDSEQNIINLAATASQFDKTLKGLRSGDSELGLVSTSSHRILRQLDIVEDFWVDFNSTVDVILEEGSVTEEQLEMVAQQNLPLLKQMNKCVKLFEKEALKSGVSMSAGLAVTINLSGKQRMLTQKMSKEFLLIAYGYNVEETKLFLHETYMLFDKSLDGLLHGNASLDLPRTQDAEIRLKLNDVQKLWKKFRSDIEFGFDARTTTIAYDRISSVTMRNIPLLNTMDQCVKMYEQKADNAFR